MFKLILQLWLWSGLAALLTGCIREGLDACPAAFVLRFRLATPPGDAGLAGIPQADRLSVFVFDEQGYFLFREEATGVRLDAAYRLPLSLRQGSYQIVAWAGYTDDYFQRTDCIEGKTRLDDFRLKLKRNADRTVDRPLPILYHGRPERVQVEEAAQQTLTIDLWQLTNRIHVAAQLDGGAGYSLQIEDDNGLYDATAGFLPDERLTYLPVRLLRAADPASALTADFRVMKLATGRKPLLKILDEAKTIRYTFDLIGEMLGVHPTIDFDYDHDFRIEIIFDHQEPIHMKVNGWEVISEEH